MHISDKYYEKNLIRLGLSLHEARTYYALLKKSPLSVTDLATQLMVFPSALYRILEKLKKEHMITLTVQRPKTFTAINPEIALESFIHNRISSLQKFKSELLSSLPTVPENADTRIDLLGGKDELFQAYASLAASAHNEILIISLGEKVSEEILLANRDCIERGIRIRFLVHRYDQTNKDLLHRWVRMGLEVRHRQGAGFHLVVADAKVALLSVSKPNDPENRVTLKIHNPYLSLALTEYFESLWQNAQRITL
jgi:sugar-specific transcriptional regulator TrmB